MKAFCFPDSAIAALPAGVHAMAAAAFAITQPLAAKNRTHVEAPLY
jgi:hypothetical protein